MKQAIGRSAVALVFLVSASGCATSLMAPRVDDHFLVGFGREELEPVETERKALLAIDEEIKEASRELERTVAEKKLGEIDVEIVESELSKAEIGYDLYRTLLNSELTLFYSKDIQERKLKLKVVKRKCALAQMTADYQSQVVDLLQKKWNVQRAKTELAKAKLAVSNPRFQGKELPLNVSEFLSELSARRVHYEKSRLKASKISEQIEQLKRELSNIEKIQTVVTKPSENEGGGG